MEERKIFDKKFVYFMWDDSLVGKEGFFADYINKLVGYVENEEYKSTCKGEGDSEYPFLTVDDNKFCFFYYDPHYEFKRAWKQGKRVQYMSTIYVKNDWKDIPDEWNWDVMGGTQYRIAPEKKWRPFKDIAELKQAWNIKLTGRTDIAPDYGLAEPMIWVRSKSNTNSTYLITHYCENEGVVYLCWYLNVSLEALFDDYTFLDETSLGVEVE